MKKATIKNGIDRLDSILPEISGSRIGLITNPTGVDRSLKPTVDILHEKGLLCCMFSPEHGVRGCDQAGAQVDSYTDEKTGLPVYSLYGGSVHIAKEILDGLDIVAFDIQDVGARFYTYMYTLSYAMEDCAAAGKRMLVLDRINPVGGVAPEGTVLDTKFSSFVGRFALATRYNLTIGEFAEYINDSENIGCDLTVVPVEGWTRDMFYDETDLAWVPPSPNIPTVESCFCYLASCLFEGTNMSEGRGTAKPFELIGAPWLESEGVAAAMNQMKLPGVKFRPCCFTPAFSKHTGTACKGLQIHITDRRSFKPIETGLRLMELIRKTHDEFEFLKPCAENDPYFIDLLLGSSEPRKDNFDTEAFLKSQEQKIRDYEAKIKKYYLY